MAMHTTMTRYLLLALLLSLAQTANAQTYLTAGVKWDDGTPVNGSVTLVQNGSPDILLAAKTLSSGWTNFTILLSKGTYTVTVACHNAPTVCAEGTVLTAFPVFTAMLDPAMLKRGEVNLVFRKADLSLKSADVKVHSEFP